MTFEEQAAELHRLEAVALSLALSQGRFERILQEVTAAAHLDGTTPADQLAEIRRQIREQGRRSLPSTKTKSGLAHTPA